MALDKLEDSIIKYKNYGVEYYSPWLVVMSDGEPNGSEYELQMAKKRIASMVQRENLAVIPIGIGNRANMKCLSQLSPGRDATGIYDVNFDALFEELTKYLDGIAKTLDGSNIIPNISKRNTNDICSDARDDYDEHELAWEEDRMVLFEDD